MIFFTDQKQLQACLQKISKNLKELEEKKSDGKTLIEITQQYDYGPNPNKKRQQNNKKISNMNEFKITAINALSPYINHITFCIQTHSTQFQTT